MRRQWLAAFGLGDLVGEILDRMDAADEDVAQGLATRLGIVDRLNCSAHIVLRGLGHRVDESHGLLAAARRGHPDLAVGVLLEVPLDQSLVIATLSRVKDTSGVGWSHRRLIARYLFFIMTALLAHGNDQGAVFIPNDRHGCSLLGR